MTRKESEARTAFETLLQNEAELQLGIEDYLRPAQRPYALVAARLLCRHSKTYAHIQKAVCNGPELTPYAQANLPNDKLQRIYDRHAKWCKKREAQLEKRISAIVAGLGQGFGVIFSGDPRGITVKITVPSGKTDDYGREGICVPTA